MGREFVLISQHFAHEKYQFLFDSVRIFFDLERSRHKLIFCKLYTKTLPKFNCIRYIADGCFLCASGTENKSSKLVVVGEHFVDWVIHVVVILCNVLNYLNLRWLISLSKRIQSFFMLRGKSTSCCTITIDIFCDTSLYSHCVRYLAQTSG